MVLKIRKLNENAKTPTSQKEDVGYDLYCTELQKVDNGMLIAKTGIAIELPIGYWAQIENRSSMGYKGISVHGGIIDNGYRGEIMVILNPHNENVKIEVGDKVAQLIIREEIKFPIKEVDSLTDTNRGNKGFGSTGK